jgi:hypothetical protein
MEFRTDAVFEALRGPLALVDDPERRAALDRYVEAARPGLERSVFDLIAAVVAAIDEQVSPDYRARLAYRPGALTLDVERRPGSDAPESPPEPERSGFAEWTFGEGEPEKVTIRVPGDIKDLAMKAAAAAGMSANSWFVRTLADSLRAGFEGGIREEIRIQRGRRRGGRSGWDEQPGPGHGHGPNRSVKGWFGG